MKMSNIIIPKTVSNKNNINLIIINGMVIKKDCLLLVIGCPS